ncbi:MAG: hypothetical protein A3B82_02625 [Methylophilales bacterium RIFCSPHIGHO2_02_FULL_57_10]|nr:MAG: hypothetical protein A3B82_02625 [Methylophilales bacterium RIFCSPHIGHO2_02_FULL_57_10]
MLPHLLKSYLKLTAFMSSTIQAAARTSTLLNPTRIELPCGAADWSFDLDQGLLCLELAKFPIAQE